MTFHHQKHPYPPISISSCFTSRRQLPEPQPVPGAVFPTKFVLVSVKPWDVYPTKMGILYVVNPSKPKKSSPSTILGGIN